MTKKCTRTKAKVTKRKVMTRTNPSDRGFTQKQIREKLVNLPGWQKPQVFLLSTEYYDVSPKGETKQDWIREVASSSGYDPYLVGINTGGYTGTAAAVLAGHPDEALQTADEWFCTRYYDSNYDACEEAQGQGEGVVNVQHLMEIESNPRRQTTKRKITTSVISGIKHNDNVVIKTAQKSYEGRVTDVNGPYIGIRESGGLRRALSLVPRPDGHHLVIWYRGQESAGGRVKSVTKTNPRKVKKNPKGTKHTKNVINVRSLVSKALK